MSHVSNLVNATFSAIFAKAAIGELINVGDNKEVSVLECAKIIHKLAGTDKPLKVKLLDTSEIFGTYKDIQRRCPDLTKAKKLLNYSPSISFEEGLIKVINERKKILGIK